MKKCGFGLLGLTLTSVVALVSANAADMYVPSAPGPGGYKDAPWAPTWAGFYVGVNGGYGWANNNTGSQVDLFVSPADHFFPAKSLDESGGFGGGQVGYNFQRDRFVFGVEFDIQGSGISDKTATLTSGSAAVIPVNYDQSINIDWFGTIRGRMGYSIGSTLLYATGGFAFGGVNYKTGILAPSNGAFSNESRDSVETGYVVGGGVEYAINPAWSVKAEYQYINLGSEHLSGQIFNANGTPAIGQFTKTEADVNFSTVRLGLNYHIAAGYEPLK
jgi:outer membrane immunogenic protein